MQMQELNQTLVCPFGMYRAVAAPRVSMFAAGSAAAASGSAAAAATLSTPTGARPGTPLQSSASPAARIAFACDASAASAAAGCSHSSGRNSCAEELRLRCGAVRFVRDEDPDDLDDEDHPRRNELVDAFLSGVPMDGITTVSARSIGVELGMLRKRPGLRQALVSV